MVKTGFRLVIGSWKIIDSWLPRSAASRVRAAQQVERLAFARFTNIASPLTCVEAVAAAGASA
jgi:hypothetical protein